MKPFDAFQLGVATVLAAVAIAHEMEGDDQLVLIDRPGTPAFAAQAPAPSVGDPSEFNLPFVTGAELCPALPLPEKGIVHT